MEQFGVVAVETGWYMADMSHGSAVMDGTTTWYLRRHATHALVASSRALSLGQVGLLPANSHALQPRAVDVHQVMDPCKYRGPWSSPPRLWWSLPRCTKPAVRSSARWPLMAHDRWNGFFLLRGFPGQFHQGREEPRDRKTGKVNHQVTSTCYKILTGENLTLIYIKLIELNTKCRKAMAALGKC